MLERRYKDKSSDFVFHNDNNEELKSISGTYRRVVQKIGLNQGITDSLQKTVFHTLRHTCFTACYEGRRFIHGTKAYGAQGYRDDPTLCSFSSRPFRESG